MAMLPPTLFCGSRCYLFAYFLELKKNNNLRIWLRENAIQDVSDLYWSKNNKIIRHGDYFYANGQTI